MQRRKRIFYSEDQRKVIWDRWNEGVSLKDIGRLFHRPSSSIHQLLARTGGIRPSERKRSARALTLVEREEISRGLVAGCSLRQIAAKLGRAPSTISREVTRNGGAHLYRAVSADQEALRKALRPKTCKLASNVGLCAVVEIKLRERWSPQQIAGWLKRKLPQHEHLHVSHENIYKTLFIQSRGALKKELQAYLRSKRSIRRAKTASLKQKGLGKIVDAVSIHERPPEVEDRAVPGHWEGDLIAGSKNSYVATLVERHSRYVLLVKVNGRKTDEVVPELVRQSQSLPKELYKSLTWDRGSELASHQKFTVATDIQVYFCDPQSPWQRGSNENTNRLLRQYLPKGTDLSVHSQGELDEVARQLNTRPRKTLDYDTPAERFSQCVASIS
ncbi:IS30 family transposase [Marinobacterium mangrovicola]|uniref:IS30 family transposase n=1 Tax=Marinobacterium mangrovicola TaxID=1476959 RepID=A0A4V2PCX3_9GAMM|nr:IS30 family transposase [Marinobacterium mangrovicola]TCK02956.1 IS30 family transposase [Marinobacterium mangrovicola]